MNNKKRLGNVAGAIFKTKELSAVIPLTVLMIVAYIVNRNFLLPNNIFDILRTASFNVIMAIPVTLMMCSGRMDLSIGATCALGGVVTALCDVNGIPLVLAILAGMASGIVVGTINGILVEVYKLPAFITTMATQYAVNGIIAVITGNNAITGISSSFRAIAQTRIGGVSLTIFYALFVSIVGYLLLNRMKYGREVLAIGGNSETARLAGINDKKIHIQLYVFTGLFAAVTGILYASRFSSAQINAGSGSELTIIASVIIGGTSMFGGSGTVIGSVLGCVLLATITNALIVMGLSNSWQKVVFGVILIIALFIDQIRIKATAGK